MVHTSRAGKRTVGSTGILNPSLSGLEEHLVRYINRYINTIILAAAVAAPAVIMAAPRPQELQLRVYDRDHRDYHNWDDREDHAYRGYLVERHRDYREYNRQNGREQRRYWTWRHSHPDHD